MATQLRSGDAWNCCGLRTSATPPRCAGLFRPRLRKPQPDRECGIVAYGLPGRLSGFARDRGARPGGRGGDFDGRHVGQPHKRLICFWQDRTADRGSLAATGELSRRFVYCGCASSGSDSERFLHLPQSGSSTRRVELNWLLILAIVLVVLWVAAEALGWLIGAVLHLLWIVALVLFAIWVFQKLRTRV